MPVKLGDNLTLEDNKLSAVYKEIYTKLNKAYAWTNTQTTSSNGSCAIFVNQGDILDVKNCENINDCRCGLSVAYNASGMNYNTAYIIDGKLYFFNTQVGSKTDYVMTSGNGSYNQDYNYAYCIDSSGKLWFINNTNNTETQIGTDTNWSFVGPSITYVKYGYGLKNGELYVLHEDDTPVRQVSSLSNIIQCIGGGHQNLHFYGYCLTSDGYLHYSNNNTLTLVGSSNNWSKLFYCCYYTYCMAINENNELYNIRETSIYKQHISNVKKSVCNDTSYSVTLTNDGKIYVGKNITTLNGTDYGTYTDISNNKLWKDFTGIDKAFYFIDEDGKLYFVADITAATPTFIQVGTGSNYQKVEGVAPTSSNSYYTALAWSGTAITSTHTVLTTKTPQVNDKTYSNENLNIYSTINSVENTTITDEYRTYIRDLTKDSYFTEIPPATYHETVTAMDLLNATNPNN